MNLSDLSVRDLRRQWKPQKERLQAQHPNHPTNIRFHRACSWMLRVEEATLDADMELLSRWAALNALYGQWDAEHGMPHRDRQSRKNFTSRIVRLDATGHLADQLQNHKPLVLKLFENPYLCGQFWQAPGDATATRSRTLRRKAGSWYLDGSWVIILDHLLDRICLLRSQLIHGASTHDSALNRKVLQLTSTMLGHLLPAMLVVWIEQGADEDWGPLCYPPQHGARKVRRA